MSAARHCLALGLDVDNLDDALALAQAVQPYFRVAKVGLELFSAAGAGAVLALQDLGFDVFLDVKLHDIPTTVGRAATVLGRLGVSYLSLHTSGGLAMVRAGVEGLRHGAAGGDAPVALGVTILTSEAAAPKELFLERLSVAVDGGCGGIVCAVAEAALAKHIAPWLEVVTPGIRVSHGGRDDQARVGTPQAAREAGADLLVIGRAVTASRDPVRAAAELCGLLESH